MEGSHDLNAGTGGGLEGELGGGSADERGRGRGRGRGSVGLDSGAAETVGVTIGNVAETLDAVDAEMVGATITGGTERV